VLQTGYEGDGALFVLFLTIEEQQVRSKINHAGARVRRSFKSLFVVCSFWYFFGHNQRKTLARAIATEFRQQVLHSAHRIKTHSSAGQTVPF